jgi:hypothetical protein
MLVGGRTTTIMQHQHQHNYIFIAFTHPPRLFIALATWKRERMRRKAGELMKEATSLKPHYSNFYTIKVFFRSFITFLEKISQTKQLFYFLLIQQVHFILKKKWVFLLSSKFFIKMSSEMFKGAASKLNQALYLNFQRRYYMETTKLDFEILIRLTRLHEDWEIFNCLSRRIASNFVRLAIKSLFRW